MMQQQQQLEQRFLQTGGWSMFQIVRPENRSYHVDFKTSTDVTSTPRSRFYTLETVPWRLP
jgi:hypothetical protein